MKRMKLQAAQVPELSLGNLMIDTLSDSRDVICSLTIQQNPAAKFKEFITNRSRTSDLESQNNFISAVAPEHSVVLRKI